MRRIFATTLLLGLAAAVAAPLYACPDETCFESLTPSTIKVPGTVHAYQQRGDHLICRNEANKILVVDLRVGRVYDQGPADKQRWHDADIADGRALLLAGDRFHVVTLESKKVLHDIPRGDGGSGSIYAFGFAAKGQAFVHRGKSLDILDLKTGKALHTIELGETDDIVRGWAAWQKVGNRLFIVGPATTICVIDLDTGKLRERHSVEARQGIAALHIEGSLAYCIGSSDFQFTWSRPLDHLTCYDMERKKSFHVNLPRGFRHLCRFGSGPYGTVYVTSEDRIERFTMSGDRCGSFTTPKGEQVLAVWRDRALVAAKDEIRLQEIKETPVARK